MKRIKSCCAARLLMLKLTRITALSLMVTTRYLWAIKATQNVFFVTLSMILLQHFPRLLPSLLLHLKIVMSDVNMDHNLLKLIDKVLDSVLSIYQPSPLLSSPSFCMSEVHNVRLSLSSCMIRVLSL